MMKTWIQRYKFTTYISFIFNDLRMNYQNYFLRPTNFTPLVFSFFSALQQYLENRIKYLAAQKEEGRNPYPHKFFVSLTIPEYIEKYGGLSNGEHQEDVTVSLAGTKNHSSVKVLSILFIFLFVLM